MNLLLLLLLVALVLLFAYLIWGLVLARKHALQFTKALPWPPADSAVYLTASGAPVMQDYGYRLDNQGVAAVVFSTPTDGPGSHCPASGEASKSFRVDLRASLETLRPADVAGAEA